MTSTRNAYVKHCVKLREKARYRREQGRLLLVGATVAAELAAAGAPLRVAALLLQPGAPSPLPPALRPRRVVRVSEAVAKKISGLETVAPGDAIVELDVGGLLMRAAGLRRAFGLPPPPAAAAAAAAQGKEEEQQAAAEAQIQTPSPPRRLRRLLALEAVQDPGNLGTLLRCAMAVGWDAVLLLPGCCDPFNEKALRAGRGAALRLPLAEATWDELAALAGDARLRLLAAEPEPPDGGGGGGGGGAATAAAAKQQQADDGEGGGGGGGVCLVLGSEGHGLSDAALARCEPVAIPMVGDMESLNVGVAGGEWESSAGREAGL